MCGRFNFTDEQEEEIKEIIREVSRRFGRNTAATGEVYPTQNAAVIERSGLSVLRWGIPKWDGKGDIINARSETVLERPTFKKPIQNRRCVIPSTGFYEWSHDVDKKKYLLRLPNDGVLYMAGLVREDGCFAILTTAASPSVSQIHSRMPVILHREELHPWLEDDTFMRQIVIRPGQELRLDLTG